MNHGGHEGQHGDMPDMCSMNMIFNWQIKDVCIVFEWWHIRSPFGLLVSCLAVFAIAAGYEYIRSKSSALDQRWLEASMKRGQDDNEATNAQDETATLLHHPWRTRHRLSRRQEIVRSILYALLVALSFWLMLVFMTYNGFLMIAVIVGAGVGHYLFGGGYLTASRSIQCH